MTGANLLFACFACVAATGAFLIADHFQGRRAAIVWCAAILALFACLYWALWRHVLSQL